MTNETNRTKLKKQDIVEASLRLFQVNGFTKTSIKQIAKEANVSQVTIYNYYDNKDALIKEVVKYLLDGLSRDCDVILSEDIPFADKIAKLTTLCNSDVYTTMHKHFENVALEDDKFYKLLIESNIAYTRDIMYKIIELGKKEHAINNDIRTRTILDIIDAGHYLQTKQDGDTKTYMKELQHILLHGICVDV